MRIGTKLLLVFVILTSVISLVSLAAFPRLVESTVIRAERTRVRTQADKIAQDLVRNLTRMRRNPTGNPLAFAENMLADEAVSVVHVPTGRVVFSSLAELQGQAVDVKRLQEAQGRFRGFMSNPVEVPGFNFPVWAFSPVPNEDLAILLVRDLDYVRNLGRPITVQLYIIIGVVLLGSLLVIGWVSRDMVRRLGTVGAAARALAEGDLTQRAPTKGTDEIGELAGHFNHMAERIEALVGGLRRSEHLRKELLVTVSHELRTPMTSIAGFAEALRDGVVRDEQQRERYYQIIAGEAARLNRLINDVFDVARLEAGQTEIRLQAMPVTEWLVEVAEGFAPVAEGAGVGLDLQVQPEAESAKVYGDRDRLDQVMSNLLSNAVRFAPEGSGITIRAGIDHEDVVFEVADQGPGLSPEEAPKVFERFWQGTNKGRGHVGAGLGLAIVKSLVEAHGGTIGVTSTPGVGATFWFRLKRIDR